MQQNLSDAQREFVCTNPTVGYEVPRPAKKIVSRVFKKPVDDTRARIFQEASDEDVAWEVELAIDLALSVIKPMLRIPAMRRAS